MAYILVGVLLFVILYFVITFAVESGVYYALIKFDNVRKKDDSIRGNSDENYYK
ncbi:hypothetical protein [Clostridium sp.]|uniref:hypothetical protein n=1 Tax=Clostridium sp. TaxID=1506 RepID=UPI0025C56380|nr:hypothetical protein [Clostridium sp.]